MWSIFIIEVLIIDTLNLFKVETCLLFRSAEHIFSPSSPGDPPSCGQWPRVDVLPFLQSWQLSKRHHIAYHWHPDRVYPHRSIRLGWSYTRISCWWKLYPDSVSVFYSGNCRVWTAICTFSYSLTLQLLFFAFDDKISLVVHLHLLVRPKPVPVQRARPSGRVRALRGVVPHQPAASNTARPVDAPSQEWRTPHIQCNR